MASLADVAGECGVSVSTVSRALNPETAHLVKADTRDRVAGAAERLGFRPNALARGLRSRHSSTVGVIVHDICDSYFAQHAKALGDALAAEGLLAVICNSERDPATELTYVQMLLDHKAAGVIFVGGGLADKDYRRRLAPLAGELAAYGGAAIALGPRLERWPAELPDNVGGAAAATRHLLELGHRRIAFVDGPAGLRTSEERRKGYLRALGESGIEPDEALIRPGDFTVEGGVSAAVGLLDSGVGFSAVFASNDATALGCLQELARRGVSVPQEVSVVGFDDAPAIRWATPALTTVAVPVEEMSTAAVARLMQHLRPASSPPPPRTRTHHCDLIIRDSTARRPL